MTLLLSVNPTPVEIFASDHKNFMMPDSKNANLDTVYYRQCVLDTDGVLYTAAWLTMETAENVYSLSTVKNVLDYAHSQGKKVILRLFYKSYSSGQPKPLPAYILNDHATYGGVATSGGLLPNQNVGGYSARLHNAALMARFKNLIAVLGASFSSHPALQGVCLDESTWSLSTTSGTYPVAGLTAQDIVDCFATINAHLKLNFPTQEVYVIINFFEGTSPANARAILRQYVEAGYLPGISDTFRMPEEIAKIQDTDSCFPMSAKTLMHVDYMSMDDDDSGLTERMIRLARENARKKAGITAWYTYGGAGSNYWAAIKNAIAVTG